MGEACLAILCSVSWLCVLCLHGRLHVCARLRYVVLINQEPLIKSHCQSQRDLSSHKTCGRAGANMPALACPLDLTPLTRDAHLR